MGLILCIETTTTNCSVALGKDGDLIALKEDMGANYSHAERLHPYISEILQKSNFTIKDLDAVAVSSGPGSYTGLRIGVSSAKGFCFAHDLPLISVDTLNALAHQVVFKNCTHIIPLLDARRMEVYSAIFSDNFQRERETLAEIIDSSSYGGYLDRGKTVFIGDGVAKFRDVCNHPNAIFIADGLPSAREMIALAEAKYKISDIEDVAYFEPFYLKEFQTS